jgi:hypothetical protein
MAFSDDEINDAIEGGRLAEDCGFRDYLRACPDPLAGKDGPGAAADLLGWSPERREHELAELQADGMYTLSRYLQTIAYRRLSDRELRAEAREAVQRLERIESSWWWRLRPRTHVLARRLRRTKARLARARRRELPPPGGEGGP